MADRFNPGCAFRRAAGFTLLEMLVVIAIVVLLIGLLLPTLGMAHEAGRASMCRSNIRQLLEANTIYAIDYDNHYVLAAEDVFVGFGGMKRWHGERVSAGVSSDPALNTFDADKSPLHDYLGATGRIKECPTFIDAIKDGALNAFESGTGGYGYNQQYVGGRNDKHGFGAAAARESATIDDAREASRTVMFTDSAFMVLPGLTDELIEYSFCEPPFFQLLPGDLASSGGGFPSIHFRHGGACNIAWLDGHVSHERMGFTYVGPTALVDGFTRREVGWFGVGGNELFDLQ